jgi:hypothetical protein
MARLRSEPARLEPFVAGAPVEAPVPALAFVVGLPLVEADFEWDDVHPATASAAAAVAATAAILSLGVA